MTRTAKFSLGQVLATPGALQAMKVSSQEAAFFLDRHATGDWGQVCPEDALLNDEALKDGGRIISAYSTLKGVKIWIITEATDGNGKRFATTIMLPSEY
jgi:hypothetical protein